MKVPEWKLKTAAGAHFATGVVLYDGETVVAFADDLFAVPICALWEPGDRAPLISRQKPDISAKAGRETEAAPILNALAA